MSSEFERLVQDIKDGELRPGFLNVSRSDFWMPWVFERKVGRIEIGLFNEFSSTANSEPFGVEWEKWERGLFVLTTGKPEA